MTTHSAGPATRELEVPNDKLRVDQVLESKHKFVLYTPTIVEFEYAGRRARLVLPIDCPACDFLVTAAADDWLFLIGRQRAPQGDRSSRGAIVIARRREYDLYVTELWHEIQDSFLMGATRFAATLPILTNLGKVGSLGSTKVPGFR